MAFDFNQFTTVCRLTADPESPRSVGSSKVIKFRIAFTGERKKGDDGQWEDKPVFMDCEAWQGDGYGKLVDTIEKYARKGMKVHVAGSLKMETWEDKNGGGKRQAIKVKVSSFTLLDKVNSDDQGDGDSGSRRQSGGSSDGGGDSPIPF